MTPNKMIEIKSLGVSFLGFCLITGGGGGGAWDGQTDGRQTHIFCFFSNHLLFFFLVSGIKLTKLYVYHRNVE